MKRRSSITVWLVVAIGLLVTTVPLRAFEPNTPLSAVDASFWGEAGGDLAGLSVASAGDVNNDGYDDIVIGAPQIYSPGPGRAYLFFGKAGGWTLETDLSNADASFVGEVAGDAAGYSVASAGDVNNDDHDDILIGAFNNAQAEANAGQTYLILGKATGWAMDTSLADADASFVGEDAGDTSGFSVASAGDVNNDGYDDILIGACQYYPNGPGKAYLILGKASGWAMDTSLADANACFFGELELDAAGYSVASAGDVDDDGYDDILIGAPRVYGGPGQAYLILGKATSGWADISLADADASFTTVSGPTGVGVSVASAGNVNGDAYDDILIGAPGGPSRAYLVLGAASGWMLDTDLSTADASFIGGDGSPEFLGRSVASASDVNGDGYDDILIGAPQAYGGSGRSYLVLGKPSGWATDTSVSSAHASFLGEIEGDLAGFSVASAGDVNKDGYADILIGAPDYLTARIGRAYLVLSDECAYRLAGDVNDDCRFDLVDFAISSANWLTNCDDTPTHPGCVLK